MAKRSRPIGQSMTDLLAALPPDELVDLLSHAAAGVLHTRRAEQCIVNGSNPQHDTVLQALAYLGAAIRELSAARAIVVDRMDAEGAR